MIPSVFGKFLPGLRRPSKGLTLRIRKVPIPRCIHMATLMRVEPIDSVGFYEFLLSADRDKGHPETGPYPDQMTTKSTSGSTFQSSIGFYENFHLNGHPIFGWPRISEVMMHARTA